MERRRDRRLRLDRTVLVTALGGNHHLMEGKASEVSGRGIRILVPASLPAGDPVRIDLEDILLLSEVCYCQPHDGGFMIGVRLDQALSGLADLARLNEALLQDGGKREREAAALSYSVSE